MKRLLFLVMIVVIAINSTGCACDGTVPSIPEILQAPKSGLDKKPKLESKVSAEPRKEAKQEKVADAGLEPASEPAPEPDTDGGSSELVSDGGSNEPMPEELAPEDGGSADEVPENVAKGPIVRADYYGGRGAGIGASFDYSGILIDFHGLGSGKLKSFTFKVVQARPCTNASAGDLLKLAEPAVNDWKLRYHSIPSVKMTDDGVFTVTFKRPLAFQAGDVYSLTIPFKNMTKLFPRSCMIRFKYEFLTNYAEDNGERVLVKHQVYKHISADFQVNFYGETNYDKAQLKAPSGWDEVYTLKYTHSKPSLDGVRYASIFFDFKGDIRKSAIANFRVVIKHPKDGREYVIPMQYATFYKESLSTLLRFNTAKYANPIVFAGEYAIVSLQVKAGAFATKLEGKTFASCADRYALPSQYDFGLWCTPIPPSLMEFTYTPPSP